MSAAASQSGFERATAVASDGAGRYRALVEESWEGPFGPNGGYIAAILLRAATTELAEPRLPPRTLTVHYMRPTTAGPAQLRARVLRAGRNNATLEAELEQGGRLLCKALITCSAPRPQLHALAVPAPDVRPPDQVEELAPAALADAPAFLQRLRLRPCYGARVRGGSERAVTGGWMEFREDQAAPYDAVRLVALSDLWWPAVFGVTRQTIGVPTLELTVHLRSTAPIAGPIFARFETETVAEGHLEEAGRLFSVAGELLAESRQLALLVPHPSASAR